MDKDIKLLNEAASLSTFHSGRRSVEKELTSLVKEVMFKNSDLEKKSGEYQLGYGQAFMDLAESRMKHIKVAQEELEGIRVDVKEALRELEK